VDFIGAARARAAAAAGPAHGRGLAAVDGQFRAAFDDNRAPQRIGALRLG